VSDRQPGNARTILTTLLERRLWIVTGKGGTGKTSLAAGLAWAAADAGRRVALLSVGGDGALASLLEVERAPAAGPHPLELRSRLSLLQIEPEAALAEYFETHLPTGSGVPRRLLRNEGFHRFLDAAPGWRDLVALGKIWQLEQQREGDRPRFDLLIVDAPATGHGLSMLSVPGVVLDTVRMGPIHRQTLGIQELLCDASRTRVALTVLPEELPVRESFDLARGLEEIGVARGMSLLNRVEPELDIAPERITASLERLATGRELGEALPVVGSVARLDAMWNFRWARMREQADWRTRLESGLDGPLFCVPYLTEPIEGKAGVERLARALGEPGEPTAPDELGPRPGVRGEAGL